MFLNCDTRSIGAAVTIVNRRLFGVSVDGRTNRGNEYTIVWYLYKIFSTQTK